MKNSEHHYTADYFASRYADITGNEANYNALGTSPLIWKYGRKARRGFHHCHTACSAEERRSWTRRYVEFIREGVPLVACSNQTRDNLRELNPGRQVEVLPYLTSIEQPAARASAGAKSFSEGGKLDFGLIGRLEKSKGTDLIIAASKRADLAGIRWHIYGDGDQAAQVAAAQGPCLQWHGSFDRSKPLSEIYYPLDAVVLPSLHAEGSPLCLI